MQLQAICQAAAAMAVGLAGAAMVAAVASQTEKLGSLGFLKSK
jgi:hypothetical protein